ncbi:hypothetical protein JCM33374_g4168 [Metschnikowia sp. JCM 33374]|nr:hypothetical protein JCM33374_g4168 [Metschnikowia sp. JCM 33374]
MAKKLPKGVTVYWGQNSGGNQQRLRHTCDRDSVDTVILAFANGFPNLKLNFANMCWQTFPSGLLHCSDIGTDIEYCQSKGKPVLLSFGGGVGPYGFKDDSEAKAFAKVVYDTFGPGNAAERPFDKAVVNGYDLDIESGSTGYRAFADELNRLHANVKYDYYLTAAPQCFYPDASLGDMLSHSQVSAIYIQFYNNWCNLIGDHFNFMTDWKKFAEKVSPNKDILMYIGLPGAPRSAGTGYADIEKVKSVVGKDILQDKNFGGFMLWDASSSEANDNYDQKIKDFLKGSGAHPRVGGVPKAPGAPEVPLPGTNSTDGGARQKPGSPNSPSGEPEVSPPEEPEAPRPEEPEEPEAPPPETEGQGQTYPGDEEDQGFNEDRNNFALNGPKFVKKH